MSGYKRKSSVEGYAITVASAEDVPFSVTDDGEMLQVVWLGAPLHESETVPVKLLSGDNVSV